MMTLARFVNNTEGVIWQSGNPTMICGHLTWPWARHKSKGCCLCRAEIQNHTDTHEIYLWRSIVVQGIPICGLDTSFHFWIDFWRHMQWLSFVHPGTLYNTAPSPSPLASVWRTKGGLKSAYASMGDSVQSLCRVPKVSCCSGPQQTLNLFFWLGVPSMFCSNLLRGLATLEKLGMNLL